MCIISINLDNIFIIIIKINYSKDRGYICHEFNISYYYYSCVYNLNYIIIIIIIFIMYINYASTTYT